MKNYVRLFLLFFWFAAVIAPSAINLMDIDNDLVVNLWGEEEQKEEEKKDSSEEKEEQIVHENTVDFSLISYLRKSKKGDFYSANYGDFTIEINLPPPEHLV